MKFKGDFVTNSSSTSFIINAEAEFKLYGKEISIWKQGTDLSTMDMLTLIENELKYTYSVNKPINILYSQNIEEAFGDGWDGGDYQFAGKGWIFCGQTNILEKVMNKDPHRIRFDGHNIKIPKQWIREYDEKYIRKKYKSDIVRY